MSAQAARAQLRFALGPLVGANASTASYEYRPEGLRDVHAYGTTFRFGAEAGLRASVALGHFALQPALLYSQRGYRINDRYHWVDTGWNGVDFQDRLYRLDTDARVRLTYVALPLNVVYTLRKDGTGPCVFAGPYAAFFQAGDFDETVHFETQGLSSPYHQARPITGRDAPYPLYLSGPPSLLAFTQSRDAGFQVGAGYQTAGGWQVQLAYSHGLRDLGIDGVGSPYRQSGAPASQGTVTRLGPSYMLRGVHVSVAYLRPVWPRKSAPMPSGSR